MALSTLFFDLGGVLVNFSHEKMCNNIAQLSNVPPEQIQSLFFTEDFIKRYEKGMVESKAIHAKLCHLSGQSLDYSEFLEAATDIFLPKPEMPALIEELKKQQYSLYVLSNTCDAHFHYLKKHYPFLSLFDGYILSYETQLRKPEKAIYEYALNLAKAPPEHSFYTDDISAYVSAAQKMGIHSHLFKTREGLITALENQGVKLPQSI